ncbi:MAG TPA: PKD domain-containing protein [Nitrosopumilaceae archaeon]|nr:PKD domain-containing protein [Nitrosopumilaceae archaeon]
MIASLTAMSIPQLSFAETVIATIPVQSPLGITFNSNNHDLYVASQVGNAVVIDSGTNNVINTIPISYSGDLYGAGFNSANGNVYITGDDSNILTVINSSTNTVIATVPTNVHARHLLFDPLDNNLYIANAGTFPGTVQVFDGTTNNFIHSLIAGVNPWGIALNPTNGHLYVADSTDNTVNVIDSVTGSTISSIPVGHNPLGLAFDTVNGYVYVANANENSISVIDSATNTLVTTIQGIGNSPMEVAFNPANGKIYVVSEGDNGVNVINGLTNTASLTIGYGQFRGITVNPAQNIVYATNLFTNTVSVISGNPTTDNPPVLNSIIGPTDPVQINNQIAVSDTFTDESDDTHTASWNWGDRTNSTGMITESNGSGSVQGTHAYTVPGVYTAILTVKNNDGLASIMIFKYVVVYDPTGGFVTGGGWINSPQGAYTSIPTLTGKATFGFNARYQNGANVPTGDTSFDFEVAGLHFKSTNYQWLVIAGAKAQFKGTGTINGLGNYGFMLTATDGQINGGGGIDKFRMKITDNNGGLVYDNLLNAPDSADPTTTLGGGSIVIHKN